MNAYATIGNRKIGPDQPVYIIAEMSGNHHQSFDRAVEIIHAMKEAGADAVKLQTFKPDALTIQTDSDGFRIGKGTIWEGKTLYELYSELRMPWEWQPKLKEMVNNLGMDLFSTPQGKEATDFLEEMRVPAHKIASFELTDIAFIEYVASKGKPMILSTGMADVKEIQDAVDAVQQAGNDQIILLKCTSAYPSPPEEANLKTIPDMRERFGVPVGLSDHSLGLAVPLTAVTLGACIVEKHFCLSRDEPGPDTPFSLEPHEFKEMVEAVRHAEKNPSAVTADPVVLGTISYGPTEHEKASTVFRRSLFIVEDVKKGEEFTPQNVRSIRPGNGLKPKEMRNIIGRKAARNIVRGTPLSHDLVI